MTSTAGLCDRHVIPQARTLSSFAGGSRNPVDSELNPCGDAFQIGRETFGVCQCSFLLVRKLSTFSAFEIRDVLNYWRRYLKSLCLRHDAVLRDNPSRWC